MDINYTIKRIGIILLLVIMPLAIGVPLYLVYDRPELLEVPLAAFGIFELLVLSITIHIRDHKKRKAGVLIKEDKGSEEYKKHVNFRTIILISAAINLALSLIFFWTLGK